MNRLPAGSKQSMVEQVYNFCLEKITDAIWQPGDKIPSESELQELLSVSKVTIRSALRMLRTMGYITTFQGKGSFVSSKFSEQIACPPKPGLNLSNEELMEITEFREGLEIKAIQLAAERATEDDLKKLKNALDVMRLSAGDNLQYTQADKDFHLILYAAAGNRVIYNSLVAIRSQYFQYLSEFNRYFEKELFENSLRLHEQIYEAIAAHDAALASALMVVNLRRNLMGLKKKENGEQIKSFPPT